MGVCLCQLDGGVSPEGDSDKRGGEDGSSKVKLELGNGLLKDQGAQSPLVKGGNGRNCRVCVCVCAINVAKHSNEIGTTKRVRF